MKRNIGILLICIGCLGSVYSGFHIINNQSSVYIKNSESKTSEIQDKSDEQTENIKQKQDEFQEEFEKTKKQIEEKSKEIQQEIERQKALSGQ